jgi:hypothetical protein
MMTRDLNVMKKIFVVTGSAVGLLACSTPTQPPLLFERSTLAATVKANAAGLTTISVSGDVGSVEITGSSGDSVRANVSLSSRDEQRITRTCLPNSRVDSTIVNGVLNLRVRQNTRNRCGVRWKIEAPARFGVVVRFDHGDINLKGIAGGADVVLSGTGNIRGSIDGGDVNTSVDVGDIDMTSAQREYGIVDVRSDVGGIDVMVGGYRIPSRSRRGSGQELRFDGSGSGRFVARTRVGKIKATIGGS